MQRYKQWLKKFLKHERPFQKEGVMYGEMKEDMFLHIDSYLVPNLLAKLI